MNRTYTKKAVILLGAGFAQEFGGPSSADLFDRIKRKLQVEGDELPQLILKKLDEYYGANNYNFETFIAALELIETYVSSATAGNWKSYSESSLIPALSNLDDSVFQALEHDATKKGNSLFFHLRDLIEECIVSIIVACAYDKQFILCDPKEVKIQSNKRHFQKFIRQLYQQGYSLKFYTTNYDRLVPELLRYTEFNVEEGLERRVPDIYNDEAEVVSTSNGFVLHNKDDIPFHYDLKRFCESGISHFNLHGSKYLEYLGGNILYNSWDQPWRMNEYMPVDGGNPNGELFFRRIIVGYSKTQRAFSQPFSFGFNAFAYDCNTCSHFFSFGYSYNDPHINTLIGTNLKDDVKLECVVKGKILSTRHTPDFLQHLSPKNDYLFEDRLGLIREYIDGMESYWEKESYICCVKN